MAPVDPQQLLKALNPLLGPTGAILGPTEAVRIASLMKDANKMVSKCIYINILKLETPVETLEKLLSVGAWDTLNDWLQESKEEENHPLLIEVLKVYKGLPVSVDILKKNNAAKTIKQLCKAENENVKTLASNIFEEWMKKVKGNNNNSSNDSKTKKKKKDKEKEREKDGEKDEKKNDKEDRKSDKSDRSSSKSSDQKSKSRDRDKDSKSNHHHHHHSSHHSHHHSSNRDSKDSKDKNDTGDKIKEEEVGGDSPKDDVATVRKGSGLKLHIKLGGETRSEGEGTKSVESSADSGKKRPSTVKRPPSKFRSTGLEEESVPSKTTKPDPSKTKRTGSDIKPDVPVKKSRLNMAPPLTVPALGSVSPSTTITTPTATSPVSPSEMHGKVKLIPARSKPNMIHESSGFMDSLTTTTRTYGQFKKKRKLSTNTPTTGAASSSPGNKVPSTPPSPVSPTTAIAKSLPSVPSFYKDTQQDESPEGKTDEREKSPSPTEKIEEDKGETEKMETQNSTEDPANETKERSISPETTNDTGVKESKGLLTTGATKKKKPKKSVRWRDDSEIKEIFYFELDEDERENVNRPKDFNQAKKQEMIHDRRVMETARRLGHDNMVEQITWYRPKLTAGVKPFDYGKDSLEVSIQRAREQGVLQALFFNRDMLPDSPKEPDLEHEEHKDSKLIPLEDVSGGDEFLYNYDEHPQAVKNPPPVAMETQAPPKMSMMHQGPPPHQQGPPQGPPQGQQNLNLPPGLNLPPDIMNLLTQLQNSPTNPNDPVMAHVQQIINNLMCGGSEQSFEQLQQIQQIMNSQMGLPPDGMMQGPPPGMPPIGMPQQGPPMGPGPRTALLGSAPPGYLPQRMMGGPPNRFGPGPQGNWGQNMGGPPPRGFMRGPRPNRGRGGPRSKVLCRHFASGSCRLGSDCGFLHPGVNGPHPSQHNQPIKNEEMGNS